MQIDILAELGMSAEDEAAITALVNRAFGPGFGGHSFFMQRHHLRLVARDPAIVGHIAVCFRAIRMGDRLVDILGLAEVCTAPERRGEGIAGRLLAETIGFARQSRAHFLVLFGGERLYAAAGFEPQPNVLRYVEMKGSRTGEVRVGRPDGLMVLPLGDLDWDPAAEIDLLGQVF